MKDAKKKKTKPESAPLDSQEMARQFRRYAWVALFALLSSLVILRSVDVEHIAGGFLISTLLHVVLYRDILRYRPGYLEKPRMMLLLGLMMLSTLFFGRVSEYTLAALSKGLGLGMPEVVIYGIPIPAGAMLVTLLFDFHTAIVFSFTVSLLAGLWQGDPTFTIYAFVGSLAAAFSIVRCKKRTAILRSGLNVLAANLITLVTILLYKGDLFTLMAPASIGFAVFSAVLVVAVVSLLLPVLEYVFKVSTDISLIELLDLDQPLMKNLMIEAPGTYHHSIIVGNLVDACAELVGANPLLARVGAYYHDIGKIKMPDYFIENQPTGASKHDKLTAHMSSMVLTSHVKEGVELAIQYKLPEEVIDIIKQHHGNALITYFYEKAKGESGDENISKEAYRYPGPKPQTRVAALIMMADAVEASSRVLNDPTPARIAALVDKIINHIFLSGQLEECELTLKNIYEIKQRFTYILTGILHKRIDYPGFDFNKKGKNEGNGSKQAAQDQDGHKEAGSRLPGGAQVS